MGLRWGLENPIEAWFRWIFDGPLMTVLYAEEAGSEAPVS